MDAAVAEAATLRSERLDRLPKLTLVTVSRRPIPQQRARESHQSARPTLGYLPVFARNAFRCACGLTAFPER